MYSGTSTPPEPSLASSGSSAVVVRVRTKTVNSGEVQAVSKGVMPESVAMSDTSSTLQELCDYPDRDKITAFLDNQVN